MDPVKRIYERGTETISIPPELRNYSLEVTIVPLEEAGGYSTRDRDRATVGAHPTDEEPADPDFPEREPQGEYETREELEESVCSIPTSV